MSGTFNQSLFRRESIDSEVGKTVASIDGTYRISSAADHLITMDEQTGNDNQVSFILLLLCFSVLWLFCRSPSAHDGMYGVYGIYLVLFLRVSYKPKFYRNIYAYTIPHQSL